MSKFAVFAGHGGSDPGAVSGSRKEKDYTLAVMKVVTSQLKAAGHTVINNRTTDTDRSISTDAANANSAGVDATVSIHLNSNSGTPGTGCETYYISGNSQGKDLAAKICSRIEALGFKNRGAKTGTYSILTKTTATAVLVETAFINNDADMALYDTDRMGAAIAQGVMDVFGGTASEENAASGYTEICGTAKASVDDLSAYIKSVNSGVAQSVLDMLKYYISEGKAEGIRGDIAFAQSCLETGNFKFEGSAVTLDQNNFCGMGVTSNGEKGNSFDTPQLGIRAQIQHLKAYANKDDLVNACVDPRFSYVTRGCAPYVEWLGVQENPDGKGWASGAGYGDKILTILKKITGETTGTSSGSSGSSGSASSSGASSSGGTYTVKSGDTLSAIAKSHGTTAAAIVSANKSKYSKITTDYIQVGWVLTIPGSSSGTSSSSDASSTWKTGSTYTVQASSGVRVRKSASISAAAQTKSGMSSDGLKQATLSNGYYVLPKGTKVTCKGITKQTSGGVTYYWMQIPSGYICAQEGSAVYVK